MKDYWHEEWSTVVEDFKRIKALGAGHKPSDYENRNISLMILNAIPWTPTGGG